MKLLTKSLITTGIIIAIAGGLLSTSQGQQVVGKLLMASGGFEAIMEKDKLNNLNKKIDLTLPVTIDGYNTKIGDFITGDTLILAVVPGCQPCNEVIAQMGNKSNLRFMALAFNNIELPSVINANNESMILATTSLQPEQFYMDSMIKPILFHIDSEGVIKKKYIGWDDDKSDEITPMFKG